MTDQTHPLDRVELPDPDATGVDAAVFDAPGPDTSGPRIPGPRIRWAGIVWGLVFAGLALAGMWLSSDAGRLEEVAAWAQDLGVGAAVGYGLLAVGGVVLAIGLVGLLRRAQRAAGGPRS